MFSILSSSFPSTSIVTIVVIIFDTIFLFCSSFDTPWRCLCTWKRWVFLTGLPFTSECIIFLNIYRWFLNIYTYILLYVGSTFIVIECFIEVCKDDWLILFYVFRVFLNFEKYLFHLSIRFWGQWRRTIWCSKTAGFYFRALNRTSLMLMTGYHVESLKIKSSHQMVLLHSPQNLIETWNKYSSKFKKLEIAK